VQVVEQSQKGKKAKPDPHSTEKVKSNVRPVWYRCAIKQSEEEIRFTQACSFLDIPNCP
jgi:hypothetical protein